MVGAARGILGNQDGFLNMGVIGGGVPVAAGYSDTFTGTNGTHLYDHDNNWTAITGHDVDNVVINDGNAEQVAAWSEAAVFYNASSSEISEVVFIGNAVNTSHRGRPCVRMGGTHVGYSAYLVDVLDDHYTSLYINKDGEYFSNGSTTGDWPVASNHTVRIATSGTTTVTIDTWVDGVLLTQRSDPLSPLGAGKPGIHFSSGVVSQTRVTSWKDY